MMCKSDVIANSLYITVVKLRYCNYFVLRTKMITLQFGKMYQGYALVMYVTSFDLTHKL